MSASGKFEMSAFGMGSREARGEADRDERARDRAAEGA